MICFWCWLSCFCTQLQLSLFLFDQYGIKSRTRLKQVINVQLRQRVYLAIISWKAIYSTPNLIGRRHSDLCVPMEIDCVLMRWIFFGKRSTDATRIDRFLTKFTGSYLHVECESSMLCDDQECLFSAAGGRWRVIMMMCCSVRSALCVCCLLYTSDAADE